jgi:hypothetical protein
MALGSGKQNKARRHSGGGPRPDRAAQRREEATDRNQAWSELSAKKQLAELDRRLGPGIGARRQRARLVKLAKAAA